jgi:Zn-dependent M32 family carboxypeptidase
MDADELTYPVHIMRATNSKRLRGSLPVADLPEA